MSAKVESVEIVPGPRTNAYGLYIDLQAQDGVSFVEQWRESLKRNPPTDKAVDVTIRCDGRTIEMTFEEFLKRVGLEIK